MENLEERIQRIEERNRKVEFDKAWETSDIRKILLVMFTYIAIGTYLWAIDVTSPWINAIVPALVFMIGNLTMPFFKQIWIKHVKDKKL